MTRRSAVVGAVAAVLAISGLTLGCADLVDTELGLAAEIDVATVAVTGGVVSTAVVVTYRVGEHAEESRSFQPQAIDLYVGDEPIAQLVPSAADDFDPVIAPGESRTVTLTAGMSGVTAPERLCGAEVTVVFRWLDATTLEIGMAEAMTSEVTCE